jgi:UPF0176 protein
MLAPAGSSHRSAYTRTYVLPPSAPRRTQLLLYYAYRHVADARAEADAQAALCASLQLTGRILVAGEGINGTMAGDAAGVEAYVAHMCTHDTFRLSRDDFKRSSCSSSNADPFSRELFVLVVDELVATGGAFSAVPLEATGQGYLSPAAWRDALLSAGDDTVVVDVRNRAEVALGSFAGADKNSEKFRALLYLVHEFTV